MRSILYVPAGTTDIARDLCKRHGIAITEIWSYHAVGEQMRFTMTHRSMRAASRARAAARRGTKATKKTARGAKRAPKAAKRAAKATKRATKTGLPHVPDGDTCDQDWRAVRPVRR